MINIVNIINNLAAVIVVAAGALIWAFISGKKTEKTNLENSELKKILKNNEEYKKLQKDLDSTSIADKRGWLQKYSKSK